MYIIDRTAQRLHFQGRTYTPEEILDGALTGWTADQAEDSPLRALDDFLRDWFSPSETTQVQTSGSTGRPKMLTVSKDRMIRSALATCRFFHLQPGDRALLCMNLKYIGAKMMVVRALAAGLELVVNRTVDGRPFKGLRQEIDFAAVVPLQLYNSLQDPEGGVEKAKLILVGGGAVDPGLLQLVRRLPQPVYSSYGMTETLSHIALRRLNGPDASESYTPLEGVRLRTDDSGRLLISAPGITDGELVTNDLVQLDAGGRFRITGRADNVIVSGGIKIQAEEVEQRLSALLDFPFALTAAPDPKFGERLVLLLATESLDLEDLAEQIADVLPPYQRPKTLLPVRAIPLTGNGKIDRMACRQLAMKDKKANFTRKKPNEIKSK